MKPWDMPLYLIFGGCSTILFAFIYNIPYLNNLDIIVLFLMILLIGVFGLTLIEDKNNAQKSNPGCPHQQIELRLCESEYTEGDDCQGN
jgi:hypothetical protein